MTVFLTLDYRSRGVNVRSARFSLCLPATIRLTHIPVTAILDRLGRGARTRTNTLSMRNLYTLLRQVYIGPSRYTALLLMSVLMLSPIQGVAHSNGTGQSDCVPQSDLNRARHELQHAEERLAQAQRRFTRSSRFVKRLDHEVGHLRKVFERMQANACREPGDTDAGQHRQPAPTENGM